MSEVLARWNRLSAVEAAQEILACCGSMSWARELVARRPFSDDAALVSVSDEIWNHLEAQDWREAFSKHPRIGERKAPQAAPGQSGAGALARELSAEWSAQEQQNVESAGEDVRLALAEANAEYERQFGRVFIVCATGKSAREMLDILRRRLRNDEAAELREAAEEQRKITNIRLKKWLAI
jgi:2-oxo-4-hydroxy-4-carboxy-5-ureidoimidazoline decarboxylase